MLAKLTFALICFVLILVVCAVEYNGGFRDGRAAEKQAEHSIRQKAFDQFINDCKQKNGKLVIIDEFQSSCQTIQRVEQ